MRLIAGPCRHQSTAGLSSLQCETVNADANTTPHANLTGQGRRSSNRKGCSGGGCQGSETGGEEGSRRRDASRQAVGDGKRAGGRDASAAGGTAGVRGPQVTSDARWAAAVRCDCQNQITLFPQIEGVAHNPACAASQCCTSR